MSVYDANNPHHVGLAALDAQESRTRDLGDLTIVMNSEAGRRFVWRLLSAAHCFQTSFTGDTETFFREGERNLGLQILTDLLEECPERFALMARENRAPGMAFLTSEKETS